MDFKVTFSELRSAGERLGQLSNGGDAALSRAQGINLSQADFGRIPWLQTRVYEAYRDHTSECLEALRDLGETLRDADSGLGATADAYEQLEDDLAEAINKFFEGVCG